jgi:hypothetical protein
MFDEESVDSLAPTAITFLADASIVMVPALPVGRPLFPAAKKMAVPCGESKESLRGVTNHVVIEILIDTVAGVVAGAGKRCAPRIRENVSIASAQDRVLIRHGGAVKDIPRVCDVQKCDSGLEGDAIVNSGVWIVRKEEGRMRELSL